MTLRLMFFKCTLVYNLYAQYHNVANRPECWEFIRMLTDWPLEEIFARN